MTNDNCWEVMRIKLFSEHGVEYRTGWVQAIPITRSMVRRGPSIRSLMSLNDGVS